MVAVVGKLFLNITSSLAVQFATFVTTHLKTLLPGVNPVTGELYWVEFVTVAPPAITCHSPLNPAPWSCPARTEDVEHRLSWSEPAEVVKLWLSI